MLSAIEGLQLSQNMRLLSGTSLSRAGCALRRRRPLCWCLTGCWTAASVALGWLCWRCDRWQLLARSLLLVLRRLLVVICEPVPPTLSVASRPAKLNCVQALVVSAMYTLAEQARTHWKCKATDVVMTKLLSRYRCMSRCGIARGRTAEARACVAFLCCARPASNRASTRASSKALLSVRPLAAAPRCARHPSL